VARLTMPDTDTPDPSASWSAKRKAWEETMAANTKRALELLATQQPRSVEVQGRWQHFKRNHGTSALRARKRQLWRERWR
jgi:hypothetical protein